MNFWKRGTPATAFVLASTIALAGCGSDDEGAGDGKFDLVAILPMSGALATFGQQSEASLLTGIEIINETSGGIDGREVELTVIDSTGDPAVGAANLQAYFADNDKPDAMFGGQYSFESLPYAPITTQNEVLSVVSSISPELDDQEKFPYTFQQTIPAATIVEVLVDYVEEQGYDDVAYIAVDDESGHSSIEAFEAAAEESGISVESDYIPADAVDATATLERLRATDPDALIMGAVGPAAATMLKSRTDIGWTDTPAIGDGSAFGANDLGKISEPQYWDNVVVQTGHYQVADSPMLSTPQFDRFLKTFKENYEIEVGMAGLACLYQDLITIKAAFELTDDHSAAGLAQALEDNGPDTIPESIEDVWFGTEGLGFSEESHANQVWGPDTFSFVPAQAGVDGMVKMNP